MAEGARRALGAEVGLATTGVAGPTEQEGRPVGTVVVGLALPGTEPGAVELRLPGDRERGPPAGDDLGPRRAQAPAARARAAG